MSYRGQNTLTSNTLFVAKPKPVKTSPNSPAGTWSPTVDEFDVRSAEAALQWGLEFIELNDFAPSPELLAKSLRRCFSGMPYCHWNAMASECGLR